jgi:hypothetical protein
VAISVSVSDKAWEGLRELVVYHNLTTVSELMEKIGSGEYELVSPEHFVQYRRPRGLSKRMHLLTLTESSARGLRLRVAPLCTGVSGMLELLGMSNSKDGDAKWYVIETSSSQMKPGQT